MNAMIYADPERHLLDEIGGLVDRARHLRARDAVRNGSQIKSLEGQARAKWDELRLLRAGPADLDLRAVRRRPFYR